MMSIIICLGLGYLAAVAGVWVVIAIIWDPRAEYRVVQSGMKCEVVAKQPAAGAGSMKVIGTVHSSQAEAQTALTADKTCK